MAYTMVPAAPVSVTDPTAVFGRRVIAAGIDVTLAVAPLVVFEANDLTFKTREEYESEWAPHNGNIPFEAYCDQYFEVSPDAVCGQRDDVLIVGPEPSGLPQLGVIGLLLIFGVLLQGLTGWTIGKLLMGLRTVRADGRRCGVPRAGLRWILWFVDGQPCGIPLVGFITGLTTQGHRRVGDMAASTFVVTKQAMGSPIVVPGMTAPPPPGQFVPPPGAAPWAPPTAPPASSAGAPPDPAAAGWAAPPPPQWSPPPPVVPPPGPPPGVEAPHWDDARNAYIQWDPEVQAWMQWDDPGQRWFKIGGQ